MLSLDNIQMHFGGQVIFDNVSLMVSAGERMGLVGRNGAGKTTLLRIICGEQKPSSGQVVLQKDVRTGYLPQQMKHVDNKTVREELLDACTEVRHIGDEIEKIHHELEKEGDHLAESYENLLHRFNELNERFRILGGSTVGADIEKMLIGLGFNREDFSRQTREFSGGWRMRIELARMLISRPEILLLDEPTNHLDIDSIQWLEDFLKDYKGSVILISHDRALLDNVTNRTVEISLGNLYDYRVPYSQFRELRQERREHQLAAYRNQQKKIADTEKFIERFRYKATKAVQVQSRIKQLEKMDIIEIELEDHTAFNINFPPSPRSGTTVMEAVALSKSYGSRTVLKDIDFAISRGEKVAFVGRNGEGKTTLSRILIGELDHTGALKKGHNLSTGYFAQNQDEIMDEKKTVYETLDYAAVGEIRTQLRNILGAFLFHGDDIYKKVRVLSGGERSRLALAQLLLRPYNFLVLDEPTNHLDMRSKDILKSALLKYDGTLIVVSHDREFLDGLVNRVIEFRGGKLKETIGGIYDFLEKKKISSLRELERKEMTGQQQINDKPAASKLSYERRKELERRIRKVENQIKAVETKIEMLEVALSNLDEQLSNPGQITGDSVYSDFGNTRKELNQAMIQWEKLHHEKERLLAVRK
jgi:ATP-binding cassette subfamily F protein 3